MRFGRTMSSDGSIIGRKKARPPNRISMHMDRATLLQHLAQAERHVVEGQRHVTKQEALIAELDQDGHDTTEAQKMLATLRHTQRLHVQDVKRTLGELVGSLQK
jgi:hypothetical protein